MKASNHKFKSTLLFFSLLIGVMIVAVEFFMSDSDYGIVSVKNLRAFPETWDVITEAGQASDITLPYAVEGVHAGQPFIVKSRIPDEIGSNDVLFFRASHQFVQASIQNKEVATFGYQDGHLFGKTPGSSWVIIPILQNQAGKELQIEVTGAYDNYAGKINEVYLGDKASVIAYLLKDRLPSAIACIIILTLGISMMIIAFILKSGGLTAALFRLGALSIITGIWSICILNILQMYIGNVFFLLSLEFLAFTILLPFFLWFLQAFSYYEKKHFVRIMFWVSIFLFFVIEVFQLLEIADYMESIWMTHILIGSTILYLALDGVREFLKKEAAKEVKMFVFTVIVLVSFLAVDLFRFYFATGHDEGFFSRLGLLIFLLMWAVEIIKNMSKVIAENARTRILETLAYTDQMTGLKNRSAFEEKLSYFRTHSKEIQGCYIVTFDMNGLKRINDRFGHARGDEAIIEFSKIIQMGFEDVGSCYRIGGDEVCVIVTAQNHITDVVIQSRINMVSEHAERTGRKTGTDFTVAGGYSKIKSDETYDIDMVYREADRMMYLNKQKMKNFFHQSEKKAEPS